MNIHDFPNYLIYDDGKVFSKYTNKFLKHSIQKDGYHSLSLRKDGTRTNFLVHRLVGIHYLPNPDNLPEIDHINRARSDNRVQNLRWSSHLDNMNNTGKRNDNKTGHIGISYHRLSNRWEYSKMYHKKSIGKRFKTKAEALCYKYIILLKIKSGIF